MGHAAQRDDDQQAEEHAANGDNDQQQVDSCSDSDEDLLSNATSFHFDQAFTVQSSSNDEANCEEKNNKSSNICLVSWNPPLDG
ncbi:hypothetical protein ACOSQ2_019801 [Xanthoceras sorbifolium]